MCHMLFMVSRRMIDAKGVRKVYAVQADLEEMLEDDE